jgi:hypothetical protein
MSDSSVKTSVRVRRWTRAALLVALASVSGVGLRAQLPAPANTPSQFDITGFLESATVSGADSLAGGTLVVNGHTITVPSNTIVLLPANALTWAELFSTSPAPYTGVATGMALADSPPPMTTYDVHVVGNKTFDGRYIAGLVSISQQALNSGAGYINYIDYATGEIFVGGSTRDRTTGARIMINDPTGRYGRVGSPDPRFTVDSDNPTIRSVTGYPMCLPRVAPTFNPDGSFGGDPQCPETNREFDIATQTFLGKFYMNPPVPPPVRLNPFLQAPFEMGDYVTFSGTLVHDGPNPTAGPWPATGWATNYVAAHTILNNIAIYTTPGTNPVYVAIDVSLVGTGGVNVPTLLEATGKTRLEGFTTDNTRTIHLYALDYAGGVPTDRDWGTVGVDPGGLLGAVQGRWRYRPPCTGAGPTKSQCTPPPAGVFDPAPREVRAVVQGAWVPGQTLTAANGLMYGQYHAPVAEYIFPEQVAGAPVPPANFGAMPFLVNGGYASSTGAVAGPLVPWPEGGGGTVIDPNKVLPTVTAAASQTDVASGGIISLIGTAVSPTPISTWRWAQTSGPGGVIATPGVQNTTFTAPTIPGPGPQSVTLTLTATNAAGATTSLPLVIMVNAPLAPTVFVPPPFNVRSSIQASLIGTCSDPNRLACTIQWTQINTGVPGVPQALIPNPTGQMPSGSALTFTVTLPADLVTTTVQLMAVARNDAGVLSAPAYTSVTVLPAPDTVLITAAEYRTGKQRLIINAASSVVSSAVVLTLQPYTTITGTTFDPGTMGVFLNNNAGLYTLDIVGVPQPALSPATPLVVKSNLGGVSPPAAVTRVRQ